MAYFPFFIDIKKKKCCIIGGGRVAYRKAEAMLGFEAEITVIAPYICEELWELRDRLQIVNRPYAERDIEDAFIVIAATDDTEVNSSVSAICRRRNILVNVVDELEECGFLFPAYVRQGDITIGITTSGKSPVMAGHIRRTIRDLLPDYYEALIDTLGGYRDFIRKKVASAEVRAAIFKDLAYYGMQKEGRLTQEDVDTVLRKWEKK